LEIASTVKFDAFVVAKNLPKIDGLSLKNHFNDLSLTANTYFILTTYNKNPEIIIRANRFKIDFVMQKPVIIEEVFGLIQRHLQGNKRL
jgi:DNA-binding response OmpR family regulator